MSVTVLGRHEENAVFEDDNGPAEIPVVHLRRLHVMADVSHDEMTTWGDRRYHRDTLAAVLRDWLNGDLVRLDTCHLCVDGPAVTTDLRDKPVCFKHAPDDDKDA